MKPANSPLSAPSYHRPEKLYIYSQRQWLERALQLGEFRLQPDAGESDAALPAGDQILPFGAPPSAAASTASYLTLSTTSAWDETLFDAPNGADCCLVIHNPEEFGERLHRAAQKALPSWAGIDAAVSYGMPSPLGTAFTKAKRHAAEREWLFAWRPSHATLTANPIVIRIGSIENIAELRDKGASL
jgi:hypothetical protein